MIFTLFLETAADTGNINPGMIAEKEQE